MFDHMCTVLSDLPCGNMRVVAGTYIYGVLWTICKQRGIRISVKYTYFAGWCQQIPSLDIGNTLMFDHLYTVLSDLSCANMRVVAGTYLYGVLWTICKQRGMRISVFAG